MSNVRTIFRIYAKKITLINVSSFFLFLPIPSYYTIYPFSVLQRKYLCMLQTSYFVTHFVLYDAPTNGNLLMFNVLSQSRSVETATIVMVKTGSLKFTLANPA